MVLTGSEGETYTLENAVVLPIADSFFAEVN
jgi:hypothetical protein